VLKQRISIMDTAHPRGVASHPIHPPALFLNPLHYIQELEYTIGAYSCYMPCLVAYKLERQWLWVV